MIEVQNRIHEIINRMNNIKRKFNNSSVNNTHNFKEKMTIIQEEFYNRNNKLEITKYESIIKKNSEKYFIPEKLIKSVIKQESNFNPGAVSKKGARGLMQLMPDTAKLLGVKNSFDPAQNIEGGVRYLKMMLNKFDGDVEKALAAYNAGPKAVEKYNGIPNYSETKNYIKKVLANMEIF